MNKLSLYGAQLGSVSFLIFDENNVLLETLVGTQNADDVWEAEIPNTIPEGLYTIIGVSNNYVLGKEVIYWNGINIVNEHKQLLEIYELYGLNPLHPLSVSTTQRMAGTEPNETIKQSIVSNNGVTTVTRIVD